MLMLKGVQDKTHAFTNTQTTEAAAGKLEKVLTMLSTVMRQFQMSPFWLLTARQQKSYKVR